MEIAVDNPNRSMPARVETRVKILAVFALIVVSTTLTTLPGLISGTLVLLGLLFWSRVTIKDMGKRILMVLPFAGMMLLLMPFVTPGQEIGAFSLWDWKLKVTQQGLDKAMILSGRVLISVLALSFLTLTTGITDLLYGLRRIGVPGIMVNLVAFTIRYFAVLGDELKRMQVARKARGFKAGTNLLNWHTMKTLGELIGVLFIRSYERGERVFNAMLARSYTGELGCCGHCSPTFLDWLWAITLVGFICLVKALELRGMI